MGTDLARLDDDGGSTVAPLHDAMHARRGGMTETADRHTKGGIRQGVGGVHDAIKRHEGEDQPH